MRNDSVLMHRSNSIRIFRLSLQRHCFADPLPIAMSELPIYAPLLCMAFAAGLAALLCEFDVTFGFLLETDTFQPHQLLDGAGTDKPAWKTFLRCAAWSI